MKAPAVASLVIMGGFLGMTALADPPPPGAGAIPPSAQLQDLIRCRGEADNQKRLACYDAAAGRLDAATQKGDLVVVDKAQAEQAHREAFGFNLPSLDSILPSLGGSDEQDSQSATIKTVQPLPNGRFLLTLDNGAVWRQMDGQFNNDPRVGQTVTLSKGSLGGFFMKVGAQPAVKARRDQ